MIHDIDLLLGLTGAPVRSVEAIGAAVMGITFVARALKGAADEAGKLRQEALKDAKKAAEVRLTLAKQARDISVSEFFAKNRHLLGFDNPSKALLTTVKEGVDKAEAESIKAKLVEAGATVDLV